MEDEYQPFNEWAELVTGVYSSGHTLTNGNDPEADDYEEIEALSLELVINGDHEHTARFVIPAPLIPGILESAAQVLRRFMPPTTQATIELTDDNIRDFIESNDRNPGDTQ